MMCCCFAGEASEEELKERQAKAMADPEVQNILMDPIMRQVRVTGRLLAGRLKVPCARVKPQLVVATTC